MFRNPGTRFYRYLAEVPWVPYAMAANAEFEWRQVSERVIEVSAEVQGESAKVMLEFDAMGDLFRSSASARPRELNGRSVPSAWGESVPLRSGAA